MKLRGAALEREKCEACGHPLEHRSDSTHECRCGHRYLFGQVDRGECPTCDEFDQEIEKLEERACPEVMKP